MANQRDNSGALFKNEKRDEQKEGAPHATGTAMIGGTMYRISAWTNHDKDGNKYQSLRFEEKQGGTEKPAPQPPKNDLDVPF